MRFPLFFSLLSAVLWVLASTAQAQVRVTNCNDTGAGSLRTVAESAPDGSIVEMRGLSCDRIVLKTGPIRLSQYTIAFQGPGWTQLTVSGDGRSRVFVHTPPAPIPFEALPWMFLRGFTVSWGRALDDEALGGCIFAGSGVTLENMQVHHCVARDTRGDGDAGFGGAAFAVRGIGVNFSRVHSNRAEGGNGGGVFSLGGVGADSSHISNNYASGDGGGAEALAGARITSTSINHNTAGGRGGGLSLGGGLIWIIRSTLAYNHAHERGAAQLLPGESTRIIQSTISNNVADVSEGGVVFEDTSVPREILNSTITLNRALAPGVRGCRGGGLGLGGTMRINSSIISGNTCGGVPSDVGIEEISTPGDGIGGNDNLIGVSTIPFFGLGTLFTNDPRLGPLADNGGRTLTHLPLADSQAIDAGNNLPRFANDQRGNGFPRVKGVAADVGSTER